MPCWLGRGGTDGAALRLHGGVFPVSACGWLGPCGIHETSHEGAEDLVHKGCVSCLGFCLGADGAHCCLPSASGQIWWITKTGNSFPVGGVSVVRSWWGMASSCCRPSRWNLHVAVQSLVCS